MKKSLILLIAATIAFCGTSFAQKNIKLGHINTNELMQIMPGVDSAQSILQKEVAEMESQMKMMQEELQKKYANFQEKQAGWSDLIRQSETKALQDMNARIEEFGANAQATLQARQEELLKPITDRAKAAIEAVAKENGYTYVFDSGVGVLLYQQDSDDLMPLVKKKLGI
ncbi:MAG: OmpH family outer membrane protein [Bacteroidales bacterium]|nr:OmpH family outer membrane protein [Bacteroidales bacterium]